MGVDGDPEEVAVISDLRPPCQERNGQGNAIHGEVTITQIQLQCVNLSQDVGPLYLYNAGVLHLEHF